ncbi:hypothetical protein N431DRAFT_481876 [Stipitochalara longipes BDJ]|nr:hypothetical protein N431DRAFT_481876 [Stipitochalara longipes BDJ]
MEEAKMDHDLAPSEGEGGPSTYNTPSSYSPEQGTSPLNHTTAEAILAMPSPGFEAAIRAALPDTPTDSRKSSRTSSKKGKEVDEVTADSEAAKDKGKAKEKIAAPVVMSDAEMALKKQKEHEEEERANWLERYRLAQPNEALLSVQDPKFQQLLIDFRARKALADKERKEQEPLDGTSDEAKSKLKTVLSRFNLRRRLSERRSRHSQNA